MLLQFIVQELDRELARLESLRDIVAGLGRTPAWVARITTPLVPDAETVPKEVEPTPEAAPRRRKRRADAGQRRGSRSPRQVVAPRALTTAVPQGPVVVSPVRLAEERARRQESAEADRASVPTPTTEENLDALTRALAARWTTGLLQ